MAHIRLTTLGRTELTGPDGGSVLSVLAQPKRLALLVYLAVEGSDGFVRRDSVAAMFWPESDQSDARSNLRKSLYYLRQSLGQDVLLTRGDEEIGIDAALLSCDVGLLLSGGEVASEGDFLEGFHFSGATGEWEDWLTAVRERVRERASVEPPRDPAPEGIEVLETHFAEEVSPGAEMVGDSMRRSGLFTLALAVVLTGGLGWVLTHRDDAGPTRYDLVHLGSGAQYPTAVQRHYALPPDGSGILFRDSVGRTQGSWWKALDALEPEALPGLEDVFGPVFSPDGTWIAFTRDGQLRKQPFGGGPSVLLVDSVSEDFNPGVAWLAGGDLLYEGRDHSLHRLREDGSRELLATAEEVGQVFHVRALPTGEGVVVTGCEGWCESATPRLSYVDLASRAVVHLRDGVWMAWPMTDGRLVMVDERGSILASTFDPSDGLLGPPVPLLDGVQTSPFPDMAMGEDGSLLYIPGEVDPFGERLVWVDRDGSRRRIDPNWPGASSVRSMALAPDGRRLAVGLIRREGDGLGEQLWIKDLPDGPLSPLTQGPSQARRPVWSSDGRDLVFVTQQLDPDSIRRADMSRIPADGSSTTPEPLLRHERMIMEVDLAGDARAAVVRLGDAEAGDADIAYAPLDDAGSWRSLFDSGANEYSVTLSPDGRWLAYVSEVSGRAEVYVQPIPGPGPRVQVSTNGAVEPRWAHSGKELFFRSLRPGDPDGHTAFMMVARVTTEDAFRVESIETLFGTAGYERGPTVPLYEVTGDDRRFIMVTRFGPRDWTRGASAYSRGWYWTDEIQAKLGG